MFHQIPAMDAVLWAVRLLAGGSLVTDLIDQP